MLTDCDFCDRLFRPNAAGQYKGIIRIWSLLDPDHPDDLDAGILVQRYATSAEPNYRQTGHRLGLAGRTKGKSPGVNPAPSRRVRPHGQSA